jgi:uncharacterized protein with NRDE domain
VGDFLRGDATPEDYLEEVAARAAQYDGFNLLVGDSSGALYFGNRMDSSAIRHAPPGQSRAEPLRLEPGVYGLSNHLLDTPWPKVVRGKRALEELVHGGAPTPGALLDILFDTEIAPADELPETGVGTEWERVLSASFVSTPTYGTRASTALVVHRAAGVTFVERSFLPGPRPDGERSYTFELDA